MVSLCLGGDPEPCPPGSQLPQRQEIHGAAPGADQARTCSFGPRLFLHGRTDEQVCATRVLTSEASTYMKTKHRRCKTNCLCCTLPDDRGRQRRRLRCELRGWPKSPLSCWRIPSPPLLARERRTGRDRRPRFTTQDAESGERTRRFNDGKGLSRGTAAKRTHFCTQKSAFYSERTRFCTSKIAFYSKTAAICGRSPTPRDGVCANPGPEGGFFILAGWRILPQAVLPRERRIRRDRRLRFTTQDAKSGERTRRFNDGKGLSCWAAAKRTHFCTPKTAFYAKRTYFCTWKIAFCSQTAAICWSPQTANDGVQAREVRGSTLKIGDCATPPLGPAWPGQAPALQTSLSWFPDTVRGIGDYSENDCAKGALECGSASSAPYTDLGAVAGAALPPCLAERLRLSGLRPLFRGYLASLRLAG